MKEELLRQAPKKKIKKVLKTLNTPRFRWHAGWGAVMISLPTLLGIKYKAVGNKAAVVAITVTLLGIVQSQFSYKIMKDEARYETSPFREFSVKDKKTHKIKSSLLGIRGQSKAKNIAAIGFIATSRVVRLLPNKGPLLKLIEIGFIEAGLVLAAMAQQRKIEDEYYKREPH